MDSSSQVEQGDASTTADSRQSLRLTAERAIDVADQLPGRVVVYLRPEELVDPAWIKVILATWSLCKCDDEHCPVKTIRVIGPKVRDAIEDGQTVVVGADQTVYLRFVGANPPVASLGVDGANASTLCSIFQAGIPNPKRYPLELIAALIEQLPHGERNISVTGRDGFDVPLFRLESADFDARTFTVVLDKGVETCAHRDTLVDGETVVISGGKKVFLRVKGTSDADALMAYWIDPESDSLRFEKNPCAFEPLRGLHEVLGQDVGRGWYQLSMLHGVALLEEAPRRTHVVPNASGVPTPFIRLEAVDLELETVTFILDCDIEVYDPPADGVPQPPPGFRFNILALGGRAVITANPPSLACTGNSAGAK